MRNVPIKFLVAAFACCLFSHGLVYRAKHRAQKPYTDELRRLFLFKVA